MISPARRRRLRLQGHAARRTSVLAALARAGRRPAGEARADPAADVRARPATARRRSSASGSAPTRDGTAARRSPTRRSSRPRRCKEFAEQTAVATRMMYAAPNRRTTHRLVALDVPTPSWMRAPGECPGMFALESAMDELAVALRHRPDRAARSATSPTSTPRTATRSARATSSSACARAPSASAGPAATRARARRDGALAGRHRRRRLDLPRLPHARRRRPARAEADGSYAVRDRRRRHRHRRAHRADPDRRRRARTSPPERVRVEIGDSALRRRAGGRRLDGHRLLGHRGRARPAAALREQRRDGEVERRHRRTTIKAPDELLAPRLRRAVRRGARRRRHRRGARARGCSACSPCGRIINPKTARSQFIGGMTHGARRWRCTRRA